jgi:hypothetical protein
MFPPAEQATRSYTSKSKEAPTKRRRWSWPTAKSNTGAKSSTAFWSSSMKSPGHAAAAQSRRLVDRHASGGSGELSGSADALQPIRFRYTLPGGAVAP